VPGEGATTTATLLASVLAAGSRSRVLLIDANLRTPSLAELFNLTGDGRGLTDLLIKDSGLDEFVRPTPHHNLFVLCGGRPLRSPAYLFAESGMDRVLSMVRESYDLAILDGAPLRDFSDSTFLAPKVDGTILVVEAEKTSSDTAEASRRQLERSGARMLGAVLNKRRSYMPDWVERFI
jgi:capsular exopolysaccharide synthesis family protein